MPIAYPLAFPLGDDSGDQDNRIVRLLKAWIGTLQPIEDTLMDMYAQLDVDNAVGAQLDKLGRLVGQDRGGLDDDDYRRFIRARIACNRSNAITEDLINVATLVVYDDAAVFRFTLEGPATCRLLVDGIVLGENTAAILVRFMRAARAAGVRLVVEWFDSAPSGIFRLDTGPGLDVGRLAGDADA